MAPVRDGIHRKVQVWIHCRRARGEIRVLLLHMIASRGGWWQPVTGGVEEGESLAAAADREAMEETGGEFLRPAAPIGFEFAFDGRWGRAEETVFALEAAHEFEPKLDPREHGAFRWVGSGEAASLLHFESNREALTRLLAWIPAREGGGA